MHKSKIKLNKYLAVIIIMICFLQTSVFALEGMGGVTIASAAPTLNSIKINEQLPYFGQIKLTVTGSYSDGASYLINSGVVWESSNTNIATVDNSGNVVFTGQRGAVTISASYNGRSNSVSVTTQLAPSSSTYITVNGLPNYCEKDKVYNLTIQTVYSDNSVEVINNRYVNFVSSDTSVATVNSDGMVTVHKSTGGFMITATYRDKTGIATSIVNPKDWVPTQSTSSGELIGIKILGDLPKEPFWSKTLQIRGEYSDGYYRDLPSGVNWSSSNYSVVSVNGNGTISYGGQYGIATITARYLDFQNSVNINIDRSQQVYEEQLRTEEAAALIHNRQKAYFSESVIDTSSIITTLEQLSRANQVTSTAGFKDIKNHWAEKEIKTAEALGIISGFADNTFKPDNKITRAEFAAIVSKAFSVRYYIDDADKTFKDVKGKWYQDDVMALKNAGVINGYADGTFKPNNNITRSEMIAIISRLIVKEGITNKDSKVKYNDLTSNYWAKKDIDKLYSLGALEMIGKNKLEPNKNATRADVVSIIVKLLQNIEKNSK